MRVRGTLLLGTSTQDHTKIHLRESYCILYKLSLVKCYFGYCSDVLLVLCVSFFRKGAMPESRCAYGAMLYCTAVATEGEAPRAVPEQAPGHVVHALPLGCVADDSTKSHLLHVQSPPLIDRVAVQGRPVFGASEDC